MDFSLEPGIEPPASRTLWTLPSLDLAEVQLGDVV